MNRSDKSVWCGDRRRPRFGWVGFGVIVAAAGVSLLLAGALSSGPVTQQKTSTTPASERADIPFDVRAAGFDEWLDDEVAMSIACDVGPADGMWFEWEQLRRNFPLGAIEENELSIFGISVDVSGDMAVVGAARQTVEFENEVDGEIIPIPMAGRVYVFRFIGGEWVQTAEINPPVSAMLNGDIFFGMTVAAASSPDEDIVAIGAPFGLFAGDDFGLPNAGAVYVYRRTGPVGAGVEAWQQMTAANLNLHFIDTEGPQYQLSSRLSSDFPIPFALFGASLDILPFRETETGWVGGDVIVVGATDALQFPYCEFPADGGTVTVFRRGDSLPEGFEFSDPDVELPPDSWITEQTIVADCTPGQRLGASVSIEHSFERDIPIIAMGAERGLAELPPEDKGRDPVTVPQAGSAFVYAYDPDSINGDGNGKKRPGEGRDPLPPSPWVLDQKVQSAEPFSGEFFGRSVAISTSPTGNDAVLVGAVLANAFDPDRGGPVGGAEGAVYVYRRTELSGDPNMEEFEWLFEEKLISLLPQSNGGFGQAISASGNTLVVGAYLEGPEDPDNPGEFLSPRGMAYVFTYDGAQWDVGEGLLPFGPDAGNANEQFGWSVALDRGVLAIGAQLVAENDIPFSGATFTYGRCFGGFGTNDCFEVSPEPGCNTTACFNEVCQFDASCCDVAWTQQCVDIAMSLPSVCGFPIQNCPGTGDCCSVNGTPGCSDDSCCQTVCSIDPFCCESDWDSCCVAAAEEFCIGLCPGATPLSCEGLCGFPDIDGCGTCSCDELCFDFGDCCSDACIHCSGTIDGCGTQPASCQGYCGGQAPSGCGCDETCFGADDCCDDVCDFCGYLDGCQGGGAAAAPKRGGSVNSPAVSHVPAASSAVSPTTAPNRR